MLTFKEEAHRYYWNGVPTPGVTELMSRVSVKAIKEDPEEEHWNTISGVEFMRGSEVACSFGTEMHAYSKYRLLGIECEYDPQMQPWVDGIEEFFKLHLHLITYRDVENDGPQEVEQPAYSHLYRYAGTIDLVARDLKRGGLVVIDWKTGAKSDKHWMQVAAYAQLIKEKYSLSVAPSTALVYLGKGKAKPYFRKRADQNIDWNNFLSILNTYRMGAC